MEEYGGHAAMKDGQAGFRMNAKIETRREK
jgi:hypothetical protein